MYVHISVVRHTYLDFAEVIPGPLSPSLQRSYFLNTHEHAYVHLYEHLYERLYERLYEHLYEHLVESARVGPSRYWRAELSTAKCS